ncbi:hypothetical protein EDC56_3581 [Sinobacterium caligoides]|uniref:PLAT domain-containing protein n=1 Tax=Sinobacterium caligoides TaxID=933926 RepID=A0A3N2DDV0_9GAMM|nr:hypothetical protein [Sinobacterium caligoides]ROR97912.1 hypothetical protein EDC56_3581 [Sinobacterium caligoides]
MTNYEVLIGTGDNDSDSKIQISLINSQGEETALVKPTAYATPNRDNYEKGSIEICQNVPFDLEGDPCSVRIKFSGDEWRLGGIWITNQENLKTWYAIPNQMITTNDEVIELQTISSGEASESYESFTGDISTGSNGTNDKVFLKLFDGNGRSTLAQRPGAPDGALDVINDWEEGTLQAYTASALSEKIGDIEYILLSKYGSNRWTPIAVTAKGAGSVSSETRVFNKLHNLNEDENKWVFCKRKESK